MGYPRSFEKTVEGFRRFPGVGEKTAERYAFTVLEQSNEETQAFAEALLEMKQKIHPCPICGNLTEEEVCEICSDPHRDRSILCVVQSTRDILAMERTQEYKGLYHVLNGLISAAKGVMPEDLNIESLLRRLDGQIKEVILATNATVEGETTALYLSKLLAVKNVLVTRIAYGLPMGGHLDYADELTLIKAFEGRKKID